MYAHFKKAPANKKLGVLYVVDSVTRRWLEHVRRSGQAVGPSASDGTYAAGVNHVTELLPALMQDILTVVPEDQKVSCLDTLLGDSRSRIHKTAVYADSRKVQHKLFALDRNWRIRKKLTFYPISLYHALYCLTYV